MKKFLVSTAALTE